ncbi:MULTISPECIES: aspartate/glutamate racemase family protein [unclassified Streptomyces]|uniref:aspartate/glutamate racemase family protein n=1 Tax=unclassified Streptomyces TaxID=2593676 RepID=UPI002E29EA74|nr:aspartate/glutamate racemase family protein [Streptomyces sp. NBC_00223]
MIGQHALAGVEAVPDPIRVLVLNCNVTESMTDVIGESARAAAAPGTIVTAVSPEWGVASAEGYLDSFIAATAMLDRLATWGEGMDAVVLAGFGEHGREAARELLDIPVVDITDAAAHVALMLAPRYGVVTTLARSIVQIQDSLRTAGVAEHCVGVVAAGVPVLAAHTDVARTHDAILERGRQLIDAGAEALVLGCAGFAGRASSFEEELGIPVIDPVAAGLLFAEGLVRLGLRTSKVSTFARPLPKARPGWDHGLRLAAGARDAHLA